VPAEQAARGLSSRWRAREMPGEVSSAASPQIASA
jgi:hypothetical protein